MQRYELIRRDQYKQLLLVEPSRDWYLEYRPCRVTLIDGRQLDCVYVVPEESYRKSWGTWPEDDSGKKSILIQDLSSIETSASRLPAEIANKIYDAGESGMGYCVFTLVFGDHTRQAYVTGNAVDFVPMPDEKTIAEIIDVIPHEGRQSENLLHGLNYYWCLFSRLIDE